MATQPTDWTESGRELESGQVFTTVDGGEVMLDRPAEDGGWYVATRWNGSWAYLEDRVDPRALREQVA